MKNGKSIQELAAELTRQNQSKRDFVVETTALTVTPNVATDGPFAITFETPKAQVKKGQKGTVEQVFEMSRFMLGQVAQHTKIPMQVVDLLAKGTVRERKELGQLLTVRLQENVTRRMVRTMEYAAGEGVRARAFLSDRFRRLDNFDLAEAVFPVLGELKGLVVESTEVTEERMYLKAIWPGMEFDLGGQALDRQQRKVNDIVQAGIVVSNSEVGSGALRVEPLLLRLVCINGMIAQDSGVRRNHVGRQTLGEMDFGEALEMFTEETLSLDDAAFYGKVQDTVRATLTSKDKFGAIVRRFQEAKGEPVTGHPTAVVEELGKRIGLNETEGQGILSQLVKGGDLSKFGLVNAVTAFARDDEGVLSYDRATDLEKAAGKVLELGPAEWKVIADARLGESAESRGRRSRRKAA
jgi:hypothetical protein